MTHTMYSFRTQVKRGFCQSRPPRVGLWRNRILALGSRLWPAQHGQKCQGGLWTTSFTSHRLDCFRQRSPPRQARRACPQARAARLGDADPDPGDARDLLAYDTCRCALDDCRRPNLKRAVTSGEERRIIGVARTVVPILLSFD